MSSPFSTTLVESYNRLSRQYKLSSSSKYDINKYLTPKYISIGGGILLVLISIYYKDWFYNKIKNKEGVETNTLNKSKIIVLLGVLGGVYYFFFAKLK
jgi:hypothetical protein